jgi:hypothetical protein
LASRSHELGIAAALVLFAAAMWFWLIPDFAGAGDQVLLPRFITLVIGALSLMMLVATWVASPSRVDDSDPFIERGGGESWPVMALAVVWGIYAFAIHEIGFYLGGGLALIASFLLMGVRRPLPLAAWTVGTLIGVWIVFEILFELRLPRGLIEQAITGASR